MGTEPPVAVRNDTVEVAGIVNDPLLERPSQLTVMADDCGL